MDEIKPQIHFYKLKRSLLFVVTVTIFSLFLCLSSGFSVLPNSYYLYFNTCLFSFLTHTLERKYIFLIFNGILAFLAKTSSPDFLPAFDDQLSTISDHTTAADEEQIHGKREDLLKEDEDSDKKEEEEETVPMDGEAEKEDFIQEEEEEELASTDELNRRIEEFIRKMKQEIRIEAQHHLITV